jgi:hypothetical protein
LLVRIKTEEQIISAFEEIKGRRFTAGVASLPDFIMERFSNWLNAYTKAFNKMHGRSGALFNDYLKRNR